MATSDLKLISLKQRPPESISSRFSTFDLSFPQRWRLTLQIEDRERIRYWVRSIPYNFSAGNCGIRSKHPPSFPSRGRRRAFISTSNPSSADRNEIKRLLGQAPAIRDACDLDLLLFLRRHPRTLLTSEQLAAFVGYDIQGIAKSLEAFIEADLLERTQNRMHAARMYVLMLDGPQNGGIRELLKLASTRNGRHSILQALDPGGSQPETEAPQRGLRLVKIA